MSNRPRARKVYKTSGTSKPSVSGSFSGGSGGRRSSGSKPGCLPIIAVLIMMLLGGGGYGVSTLMDDTPAYQEQLNSSVGSHNGWYAKDNTNQLNKSVDADARDKYTNIKNSGNKVTIMVYMCGTDLESKSAMATRDINEMLNATVGNDMNLIVYTGGCTNWRNNTISSKTNQIWQVKNGKFTCLVKDAGNVSMTKPSTLTSFINWTKKNYPANRNDLIFWDHGGGSISGYGYDQKHPGTGSMNLAGINQALKDSGMKFDFIGFDACLMATSETALMLGDYADYLIGSEESEPGIGWYYTNWLTELNNNTALSTLETGKMIADDFTSKCAASCPGQSTTLSVVDLAELSQTLPKQLRAFAKNSSDMISDGEYKEVAKARCASKEFAPSTKIDQIDLVHFAKLIDSKAGNSLADTILSAVKYNRTSKNTTNAYGLSIYFPYRSMSRVDTVSHTYNAIGIDDEYTDCIQKFAQMEVSGQAVAGGSNVSPIDVLMGSGNSGNSNGGNSSMNQQAMEQLIGQLLSGTFSNFNGRGLDELNASNTEFLRNGDLNAGDAADYISANRITSDDLIWEKNDDGQDVIKLTEEQWGLVENVDMQLFYDDGNGYIDLGCDNLFEFDDDGNLLPYTDKDWISLDGQIVSYYHTETTELGGDKYVMRGYVPISLNGQRANLILTFDNDNEQGYIAGVSYDYDKKVTETSAKNLVRLDAGDEIQFLSKYYGYNGKFKDYYKLGKKFTVDDPNNIMIWNINFGNGNIKMLYKFTDIYGQEYWTPEVK